MTGGKDKGWGKSARGGGEGEKEEEGEGADEGESCGGFSLLTTRLSLRSQMINMKCGYSGPGILE